MTAAARARQGDFERITARQRQFASLDPGKGIAVETTGKLACCLVELGPKTIQHVFGLRRQASSI